MANLEVQPNWSSVRQLEANELARGGPNGNLNEQAKALLARTEYLNQGKADKSEIVQGIFEFGTYAEFNAVKATLPLNCTIVINEKNETSSDTWGFGNNHWNGTTLKKSAFNPAHAANVALIAANELSQVVEVATETTVNESIRAELNADRAELAAIAAATDNLYGTMEEGITATASGDYFYVVSVSNEKVAELYKNNEGVAEPQNKSTPSSNAKWRAEQIVDGIYDQKQINLYGGKKYDMPVGGYPLNASVLLDNGDIVKSTIPNNINDPNTNMLGWVSVGNMLDVNSIADMLAIENPKDGMRVYVNHYDPDQGIWGGGGFFIYDSSKATINDGGMVINGWVRSNVDYLTFDMFGVQESDAASQLAKLYAVANTNQIPVLNNKGVYTLKGSQVVIVGTNSDLTGTTFKFDSSYTGKVILRNSTAIIHDSSSDLVTTLSTSTATWNAGDVELSELAGLDDSYLVIETNQPLYNYRDTNYNLVHFTAITKRGYISKPLRYALAVNKVTKVVAFPAVRKNKLTGLTLDFSELNSSVDVYKEVFGLNGCVNFDVDLIIKNGGIKPSTYVSAFVYNTFDSTVDIKADTNIKNATDTYSYVITLNALSNVTFKNLKMFGDGWGAISGSVMGDLTFINSDITRIDSHQIFVGDVIVENSRLHSAALSYNTIGDTYVNNSKWILDSKSDGGFFTSRYDAGGWCDGNLYIDGLTIEGETAGSSVSLLNCQADGYLPPAGSPASYRFFKHITLKNISDKTGRLNTLLNALCKRNKPMMYDSISLENVMDVGDNFNINIENGYFAANTKPVTVSVKDAKANTLVLSTLDPNAGGTVRNNNHVNLSIGNLFYSALRGTRVDIGSPVTLNSIGGEYARYRYWGAVDNSNFNNSMINFITPLFKSNDLNDATVVNMGSLVDKISSNLKFINPTFKYSVEKRYTWNKLLSATISQPVFDGVNYLPVTATATTSFTYEIFRCEKVFNFQIKTVVGATTKIANYQVIVEENNSQIIDGLTISVSDSSTTDKKAITFTHNTANAIKYIRLL